MARPVVLYYRLAKEEADGEEFGEEYRLYRLRTSMFVPLPKFKSIQLKSIQASLDVGPCLFNIASKEQKNPCIASFSAQIASEPFAIIWCRIVLC